jgi:uncharacterized protein YyaL (SSP411 family)
MTLNRLATQNSPYLLQHRLNPVDWYPWGKEALATAQKTNKLMLVSIGYSACHWCHVMERESFEDQEVADLMNSHYINIKVDREERPDIDQVYMLAVQLMTNRGGWPLHCICLPDGRPIYGGTYFPKQDWMQVLQQIAQLWQERPALAIEYAEKLTKGIKQSELLPIQPVRHQFHIADLQGMVDQWKGLLDYKEGGMNRAPKFPMPNNYHFLLHFATITEDSALADQVHLTLQKMAQGGIYDQVGGGFSRYSVDPYWHVPHFEKMLYDNAQLISLYTEAYQHRPLPLYKRIVEETIHWAKRDLLEANGGFSCALDADSEGIEGKYYLFSASEIREILQDDAALMSAYFGVTEEGNWEEASSNILTSLPSIERLLEEAGMSSEEWEFTLQKAKDLLLAHRSLRIAPSKDTKQLCSWNALMLKALTDAYRVFGDLAYYDLALQNVRFIEKFLIIEEDMVLHQPRYGTSQIGGFLDDYACLIQAYIALYETTFEDQWATKAKKLAYKVLQKFQDHEQGLFYYVSNEDANLIARKHEIMDNVIPSSNSILARQFYKLGYLFDDSILLNQALQMLSTVYPSMESYGSAYSNWASLYLEEAIGMHQWVCSGTKSSTFRSAIDSYYLPNKLVSGGQNSALPLTNNRISETNQLFHCLGHHCSLPIQDVNQIEQFIK